MIDLPDHVLQFFEEMVAHRVAAKNIKKWISTWPEARRPYISHCLIPDLCYAAAVKNGDFEVHEPGGTPAIMNEVNAFAIRELAEREERSHFFADLAHDQRPTSLFVDLRSHLNAITEIPCPHLEKALSDEFWKKCGSYCLPAQHNYLPFSVCGKDFAAIFAFKKRAVFRLRPNGLDLLRKDHRNLMGDPSPWVARQVPGQNKAQWLKDGKSLLDDFAVDGDPDLIGSGVVVTYDEKLYSPSGNLLIPDPQE